MRPCGAGVGFGAHRAASHSRAAGASATLFTAGTRPVNLNDGVHLAVQ